eukprot:5136141-Prymnesium_polylepis.1
MRAIIRAITRAIATFGAQRAHRPLVLSDGAAPTARHPRPVTARAAARAAARTVGERGEQVVNQAIRQSSGNQVPERGEQVVVGRGEEELRSLHRADAVELHAVQVERQLREADDHVTVEVTRAVLDVAQPHRRPVEQHLPY